jgi:Ca2+/Na+ antiporter
MKNSIILVLLLTLIAFNASAQTKVFSFEYDTNNITIGIGSVLAIVFSWSRNNSVLLAILHSLFGWLYVMYYVITRNWAKPGTYIDN